MSSLNFDHKLIDVLERQAQSLPGFESDYDAIIQAVRGNASGNAKEKRFVLIGEATHGTAEFYRIRAEITRRLIVEEGFDAIAVEADWPDAYRVNRYVSGQPDDVDADAALSGFERFPTWMWRNTEVRAFVEWLHDFNEGSKSAKGGVGRKAQMEQRGPMKPVGFYGLDLYSMTTSMEAVLEYLDKIDPKEAEAARGRYACFGQFINDPQAYGYAIASGRWDSCEQEVITQLIQLQQKARLYIECDGAFAKNEYFSAQQNAELIKNAEEYYRAMFRGRPNTWNLRDRHMFETLEKLAAYVSLQQAREARIVVWAHNSHLGNATATDMGRRGEINIGQLVSEKYGDRALCIGFSTSRGTVTAASDWDGPVETKTIREPLSGSYEEIFSQLGKRNFFLDLRGRTDTTDMLRDERLQRAIGVIYRPETERMSHYFYTSLPRQFDFMIHIDETEAVTPLPSFAHKRPGEMDETYPSGL
ncbi:erythromycin esterase family protein [Nitrosospira sp. Nsp13]|jgi:erythromycin esterase-like protein|uniref:erythromycin esterase family protein n=1 Tax=Nitrosospira sp. Nsp13 TaxID=1855332 RepID=UPI0008834E23|nr:erythromycin esterase family protein [Nitrosospira sp. Nsp13]SCY34094.1 Erythromycin esterase homolog [Nitrosospira sp. Nsp13]